MAEIFWRPVVVRAVAIVGLLLNVGIFGFSPIGTVPVLSEYVTNASETERAGLTCCRVCGRPGEKRGLRSIHGGSTIVACEKHRYNSGGSEGLLLLSQGGSLVAWIAILVGGVILIVKVLGRTPVDDRQFLEWRNFLLQAPVVGVLCQFIWWFGIGGRYLAEWNF
ncbi:MAG: hypothetical protein IPM12_04765 [Flavobacteriales bacterium]|nr:hypothetical protein [Flavobacteriales bacterium]